MIKVNQNRLNEVNNWPKESVHILTDFDRTITIGNSDSSWAILAKSPDVPKEYVEERSNYFAHYRPIEVDENLDFETKNKLMIEWWTKHINLFIKYKLSEKVINDAAKNLRVMEFRKGADTFLKTMHTKNIPVIIISAGIGNFIEQFLINNNCYYNNIYIISNYIKFENGIATGVCDNIIHSLNKNEVSLPDNIKALIKGRSNVFLLGDSLSDVKMINELNRQEAFKIGFLEENIADNEEYFNREFDMICKDNTSFDDLVNYIGIFHE